MLTDVSVPTSTGFATVKDNLGLVRNSGIEAYLSYGVLQQNRTFLIRFRFIGDHEEQNYPVVGKYACIQRIAGIRWLRIKQIIVRC